MKNKNSNFFFCSKSRGFKQDKQSINTPNNKIKKRAQDKRGGTKQDKPEERQKEDKELKGTKKKAFFPLFLYLSLPLWMMEKRQQLFGIT